jgi:glycosyltransferase involved in cell wall biosynthesis
MSTPALSVGLPVYNGEVYLRTALDSIVNQDFRDFELIISDNASTDGTAAICREYARSDDRIRYYRAETNQGGARNLNRVFELSRGKYFKWAAHDDVCLQGFFRRCIEVFDRAPSRVVLVYPQTKIIDEFGRRQDYYTECLEAKQFRPHQRASHVLRQLSGCSAQYGLIRSEALRQTRLIDKIIAADFVLLAELAMLGEFWEVPELLFERRLHPGMSDRANRSWTDLLKWSDPSSKGYRLPLSPMMRLGPEYVRSIKRLPLDSREKRLCYVTIPTVWYTRVFRNWGGRHKQRLLRTVGFDTR